MKHIAENGRVWKRISDDKILGPKIYLGKNDSIVNYIQVEKPIIEEEIVEA